MNIKTYFKKPTGLVQRRYEALRLHYVEGVSLSEAADKYNISKSYLLTERTNVAKLVKENVDPFFIEKKPGPKSCYKTDPVKDKIIDLRKQNFSILDIKSSLEGCGIKLSHDTIYEVLKNEGFSRLPRRSYQEKGCLSVPKKILPPRSSQLVLEDGTFSTCRSGAILSFLPLIENLGIITAIKNAGFPETKDIPAVSYVLSFLALKLIGNQRLSHDESWSLDRVLGLFAGLNVLPKSASLSSYSYRVSRECNRRLLVELNQIFNTEDSGCCEFNLDFKTIPHWGDESILEKNYSTTRGKSVKSVLALIVQNISSSNIAYTNAETTHNVEKDSVLEFVDFWKESTGQCPKMLIFDSQFTIHENLRKLDEDGIKFLTLRRRTKKMLARALAIPKEAWTIVKVDAGKRKPRQVLVYDEIINLPRYKKPIRQLIIIDHSKQPVFMLTNDLEAKPASLIRKYGRRWLVEQEIAEQIAFFHLNQLSSSIVVKVDFDLTMTVLAHNLYRILGSKIPRHENNTAATLHRRFIDGRASVDIVKSQVLVTLTKRAHSPLLFEVPWMNKKTPLSWHGFKMGFQIGSTS